MSVVFKSIRICSMVEVVSTCGDKIEVEKRDLGQPSPISYAIKKIRVNVGLCDMNIKFLDLLIRDARCFSSTMTCQAYVLWHTDMH